MDHLASYMAIFSWIQHYKHISIQFSRDLSRNAIGYQGSVTMQRKRGGGTPSLTFPTCIIANKGAVI